MKEPEVCFFLLYCELSNVQTFFFLAYKSLPSLEYDIFTASGERGWIGNWHCHADDGVIPHDEILKTQFIDETRMFVGMSTPQGITRHWTMKLRGYLKPRPYDCTFEFELTVAGRAKVHTTLLIIVTDGLLSILIALRR